MGQRQRVLWLDDKIQNYPHYVAELVFDRYLVATAASPKDALNAAAEFSPEIILLDYKLSTSNDQPTGLDALRELAWRHPNASVGFLTAFHGDLQSKLPLDMKDLPVLPKKALEKSPEVGSEDHPLSAFVASLADNPRARLPIHSLARTSAPASMSAADRVIPTWPRLNEFLKHTAGKVLWALPLLIMLVTWLLEHGVLARLTDRLLAMFVGYVLIAAAWALHVLRVPIESRKYADPLDYYKARSPVLRREPALRAEITNQLKSANITVDSSSEFYLLGAHYEMRANSQWLVRLTVSGFLILGYLITLWPSVSSFLRALQTYYRW